MDPGKLRYQKIRGFRDVDMAQDGKNQLDGTQDKMERYFKRWIHSFIHSGYLYSAPSRNLLKGALSQASVKEKCLKKLAERRHFVLR